MQAYLQTDPRYAGLFTNVWLWNDFLAKGDFGGKYTGIDLVARTASGDLLCHLEGIVSGLSRLCRVSK